MARGRKKAQAVDENDVALQDENALVRAEAAGTLRAAAPTGGNPEQVEADRRYSERRADERAAAEERRAARAERREQRHMGVTQGASAVGPAGTVQDPLNPYRPKAQSPYRPLPTVQEVGDRVINRPFGSEPQVEGGVQVLKGGPVSA